jgi:hypothetical protein
MNNDLPRWATAFVMPMLNLLSALLVAALVIYMLGEDPAESLAILVNSAILNPEGLSYTLFYASPSSSRACPCRWRCRPACSISVPKARCISAAWA